jgi:hypothetical protein
MTTRSYGDLFDYYTAEYLGPATREQRDASRRAAKFDGGAGVILIIGGAGGSVIFAQDRGAKDAQRCYVQE